MILIECPECKCEVDDEVNICEKCGFDLLLYRQVYERIYNQKIQALNKAEVDENNSQEKTKSVMIQSHDVHRPRCPYCNSENLTRITAFDKAVNIAMFGVFGNKRRYQWHCNNCKTNW